MTYSEKLQSPKWQKKRLEILQRDEFTCQGCSDKDSILHVHHRVYFKDRDPWDYDNSIYVTLCNSCHKDVSDIMFDLKQHIGYSYYTKDRLELLDQIIRHVSQCSLHEMYLIRNYAQETTGLDISNYYE